MKTKFGLLISLLLLLGMALTGCKLRGEESAVTASDEPVEIDGSFTYTNDFAVETYYYEQAVALLDMHGFVIRDRLWELPVDSQVLGYLSVDFDNNTGTYTLQLPRLPKGVFNDVDNNGKTDTGVQIFAVGYSPNLAGGPFSEGDDPSFGWPTYLASVRTDTENNEEVTGGKLVIWAPDAKQQFPTGFGDDGLLFTADDPIGAVPAGWSVIDLDTSPFTVIRQQVPDVTLYEPTDIALKDFSSLSYTEAFNQMFDIVRQDYAYNGIEGKQPDWDAVYSEIFPKVQAAEDANDAKAYFLAIRDFTWAFKDGHVGMGDGDIDNQIFTETVQSGYGFAIRELDDGRTMVTYVTADGPAELAGIQKGAVVTEFDGQPIADAIGDVKPLAAPQSTDWGMRYQQSRYLLRAPAGTQATVTFTNPDDSEALTVTVTAANEMDSFRYSSIMRGYDYNALPVEFRIITTDMGTAGYIKINSNYDDLNLIIRLFERALKTFEANEVDGIIIDMRQNAGGANLGLAGFLYDQEIPMGQLEYYSSETGKFEPEGPRDKVLPNVEQYSFNKMILMVGQACASACELEAYGFSQVPGMQVIGVTPSSGTEGEVSRGQFVLPADISMQVTTGRFTLPDGSIFLEGTGVQPTIKVPIDENYVLADTDVLLEDAVNYITMPGGAGVTPTGNPVIAPVSVARSSINGGSVSYLEQLANEGYDNPIIPGKVYTFNIPLAKSQQAIYGWGWCTIDEATTDQNFEHIQMTFSVNGTPISEDKLAIVDQDYGSQGFCRTYGVLLDNWPAGEHHLETTVTFDAPINDGMSAADYAAGTMTYDYTVYVAP
jgi:C-terminal processing protease CtpA/Prc